MALATTAVGVAGIAAVAAYLDARFDFTADLKALTRAKAAERLTTEAAKENKISPFYLFEVRSRVFPNAIGIWSRTGTYTWSQVYDRVCQYGGFFLSLGVQPGQNVGLYLQNAPEFMFIWLGLLAIGCAPAMINWNLAADPLVHCVTIAGSRLMIVDEDQGCQKRVQNERKRIEEDLGVQIVTLSASLRATIASSEAVRPDDTYRQGLKVHHPCALIYTSGTTGLPKLFPCTAGRVYLGAALSPPTLDQKPGPGGDRWYDCMPLYHGTGGITGLTCLLSGISLAIGKKFSIAHFWEDVIAGECTFIIYVGEAARYLLAAPPSPLDKRHKVRCMFGNGLRPDVWTRFQERFGVPEVLEFFTSTEGMLALANYSRGPYRANAVGYHGFIFRQLFHNIIVPVEIDAETGEIYRSATTGFANRKSYKDGGEILLKVPDEGIFPGYWKSPAATAKRFARDVFRKGDLYYRSGDALRRTNDGRWYFIDRLGDTFRWKSENVSTAEVGEKLGKFPGILEANVYGVVVPGHEGKAGCAALTIAPSTLGMFDWKAFARFVKDGLPRYANPVFIRVMNGEVGGLSSHNNKQDKVRLRIEGVDPKLKGSKVTGGEQDRIRWITSEMSEYLPFTNDDWNKLSAGQARL